MAADGAGGSPRGLDWRRQADRLEKELEGLDARPRRVRLAAD